MVVPYDSTAILRIDESEQKFGSIHLGDGVEVETTRAAEPHVDLCR